MKGNKLKHSFVKTDKLESDFVEESQNISFIHTTRRVVDNNNIVVIYERVLDNIFLNSEYNFTERLKNEMYQKLLNHLIEEDYIEFRVHHNQFSNHTDFSMRIKASKNGN